MGTAANAVARARTDDGLTRVRAAAAPADMGRSAAAFADGRAADPSGLDNADLLRLARIRDAHARSRRCHQAPLRIRATS